MLRPRRQLSAAQRLLGFDAVALDAAQAQEAKVPMEPKLNTHALGEGSPGTVRAPAFAATEGAFMSAMPAEARSVARATLRAGLKELNTHMHAASTVISDYLDSKAEVAFMDCEALERTYDRDIRLAVELEALIDAGYDPQDFPKYRSRDVGFRMCCSYWDQQESWSDGLSQT